MQNEFHALLRKDFRTFTRKAFAELHPGQTLGTEPYLDLIAEQLAAVERGESKRLIINLPPRHLKTFLCSKALPAWVLGHWKKALAEFDRMPIEEQTKARQELMARQQDFIKRHRELVQKAIVAYRTL